MTKIIRIPVLISLTLLILGCDKQLGQVDKKAIEHSINDLQDTFEMSKSELQKLKQIDYKVVSIPNSNNAQTTEMFLSQLGKERWDCFNVVNVGESLRIFCKRPTATPLRYVPGSIRENLGG